MGLPINIDPASLDNSQNISVQVETDPIDISPDKIPIQNLNQILGVENYDGKNYGTGVSQIAKPYQSTNFKSGVSGWRLNSNGIIEAVGVILSGTMANTGNSASATKLATARAIYGNNFDGTAALTQIISSAYGGTGNGFTKFSGPASTEKTFTLPNSSETLLYSGGALGTPASGTLTNCTGLPVAGGGTGATSLTGILLGNGTSAITTITPLAGTKVYYVADSSGGAVTRKLTFTDGILTSET